VIANDLSASAVAAMARNIQINGLGAAESELPETSKSDENSVRKQQSGKVRINEGDAWCVSPLGFVDGLLMISAH
jgi:tRNA (guanine26-N2/guanine27-N2)-dimethyltransferase